MRKILFTMGFMLSGFTIANAQNSLISKAETLLGEDKVAEAAETLAPALTSGLTKNLAGAYNLAGNIHSRYVDTEIRKAAANQPLDTALFISSLNKAIEYFNKSHELDVKPDAKGRVKSKYAVNNKKMVAQMLPYFQYAGVFQNANKDLKGAYDSFTKFVEMPKSPVFSSAETDSIYKADEKNYKKMAYYASMLAYQMKDWNKVLANVDRALTEAEFANDGYMMKLAALLQLGDTAKWVESSKEAIKHVTNNTAYTQNLLYYYNQKHQKKESLETANEIVETSPNNKIAWYARGCILLNDNQYANSRTAFQKALELDPQFWEASLNLGVSYINEIVSMRDQLRLDNKEDREKVLGFYRQALPHFEKVRELAPKEVKIWGPNLKNVYYNLGEKEKEKEVDALLGAN